MVEFLAMSTPPGTYDTLDALDAASAPITILPADAPAPFESQTQAAGITWGTQGEPSLAEKSTYVTLNDSIALTVFNSNPGLSSVSAYVRIMRPDGIVLTQIVTINNPTSNRGGNAQSVPLPEGMLLAVMVGGNNVPLTRGQCWVNVYIVRNLGSSPPFVEMLIADYLTTAFQPTWPEGDLKAPTDDHGVIYLYQGQAPNAGNEAILAQPANTRWRWMGINYNLTASATVGNRFSGFQISVGGVAIFLERSPAAQTAGQFDSYTYGINLPIAGPTLGAFTMPLGADFFTGGGTGAQTATVGLLGTDAYSLISVLVEEWIDI
jgi:hypothetical protein